MTIDVAWNLLWLRPGVVGGSEEYATRQLRALVEHAPDVRVTAFVLRPFVHAHADLASQVRCVIAPLDGAQKVLRVAAETTWLAARTRKGFDVVHHVGGRMPLVAPGRRVLTLHDLQPLEQPGNFSPAKRWFLARSIPRSVGRAAQIVTPSEHVRAKTIARFALPPDRVHAIAAPVAPPDRGAPPDGAVLPADLRVLVDGGAPYFLYPAITYVHKNHAVLLDAFARVRATHPDARLVLTGGAGGTDAEVAARIARPDLAGAVLRPGRVAREVLDTLVEHATALTFPSRYEGFGLPVVEALAVGCPVIAADASALPEVVGPAGDLVDPDDVAGWAAALSQALTAAAHDPARRAARAAAGRAQARRYDAPSVAAALRSVYQGVVAGW